MLDLIMMPAYCTVNEAVERLITNYDNVVKEARSMTWTEGVMIVAVGTGLVVNAMGALLKLESG